MKLKDDHDENDLSLDWPQKRTVMVINAPPSCPSFATLPADVVRIIFSYFALHPLIHALGLVCKRWRSYVLSGITKISLRHGTPPVSLFPSLTEIAIHTGDVCRCHTLTQLTLLRTITMTIPECLCVHHIVRRNISNLTSLSLQFPVLSRHSFDSVLTDTTAPALRHLSLTLHSVSQTKVALNFISQHSYQLLSLRLHSPHLADSSVVPLLLSLHLPYLRHIGLSRFTHFDLSQAPLVESIGFQLDCRVHPELVPVGRARFMYGHLGEAPYVPPAKITYLVLAPMGNENAAYHTVAQMERLEHVVLRIPPLPAVQPPDSMLKGLRHLHTLEVIGHDAISLSTLNALTSLTHLSLTLQPDTLSLNQARVPLVASALELSCIPASIAESETLCAVSPTDPRGSQSSSSPQSCSCLGAAYQPYQEQLLAQRAAAARLGHVKEEDERAGVLLGDR